VFSTHDDRFAFDDLPEVQVTVDVRMP